MTLDARSFNDLSIEEQDELIRQLVAVREWNEHKKPVDLTTVKTTRRRGK